MVPANKVYKVFFFRDGVGLPQRLVFGLEIGSVAVQYIYHSSRYPHHVYTGKSSMVGIEGAC